MAYIQRCTPQHAIAILETALAENVRFQNLNVAAPMSSKPIVTDAPYSCLLGCLVYLNRPDLLRRLLQQNVVVYSERDELDAFFYLSVSNRGVGRDFLF